MALTVIPAPDMSGQTAGWQMLADSIRQRNAERRQKQAQYQDLILKLSAPDTTEEQQNAVLTQDPKQFEAFYGVPLSQVGKDVDTFRTAVGKDITTPSGMVMNRTEPAGTKRLLVPHPSGTPGERQAEANLTKTGAETQAAMANTAADTQRTEYYRQQLGLNADEAAQKEATFTAGIKQNMRTVDGKVPTMGQVQDFKRGTYDLYPTTEMTKRQELVAGILGGDPNDPAARFMQLDLAMDYNVKNADLKRLEAVTESEKDQSALAKERLKYLEAGIDPDTMKMLGAGATKVEPKELMALSKSFNEAFDAGLGPLGFPSKVEMTRPWSMTSVLHGRQQIVKDPKLAAAMFGSGKADPMSVRADIIAAVGGEGAGKIKSITVPGVDKQGMPTTLNLTLDQAVPAFVQMRRRWATTMPAAFAALRQASPRTLVEIAAGNPVVEQMAQSYAPDVAANIAKARADLALASKDAAPGTPGAPPPVDPNVAPILELRDSMQRELDDLKKLLQGSASPAPAR